MTPEEAFEKWWEEGGNFGVKDAFLAGIQHQEMNQINCLYEIRKAVGDPEGRLMQSDLVAEIVRIKQELSQHYKLASYGVYLKTEEYQKECEERNALKSEVAELRMLLEARSRPVLSEQFEAEEAKLSHLP
jgi:hypothetical protein